jgi:3-oxoacyl-[acyl-carrier protein] reductase
MELSTSKILVTGGSNGIGYYLTEYFSRRAEHVIVLDVDPSLPERIADLPNVSGYVCDLTDPEAVERTINDVVEAHGCMQVCVNNAGIIHNETLINLMKRPDRKHAVSSWKKVMDINLNAVFYVSANVADAMIRAKQKGVLINISSIAAQGNVGQSAYAATKAAVEALTKTWSKELGMFKIRTGCIAPGFFDTPSTRTHVNEHMLEKWQKMVPIQRLGALEEVALAVQFIIENEYFNGKVLALDGGLTL